MSYKRFSQWILVFIIFENFKKLSSTFPVYCDTVQLSAMIRNWKIGRNKCLIINSVFIYYFWDFEVIAVDMLIFLRHM